MERRGHTFLLLPVIGLAMVLAGIIVLAGMANAFGLPGAVPDADDER